MIKLGKHIEYLLLEHDCVIVPGFGGFTAQYLYPQCKEDIHTLYPPYRTLGFNSQLEINDSLLAQSYITAYDLSYPEAIREIEREVKELKQILSDTGEYEITGVGILSLNSHGSYEFLPREAGIMTPNLYALSSFELTPILTNTHTLSLGIHEKSSEDASVIKIKVRTLRNIAVACVSLLLVMFFSTSLNTGLKSVPKNNLLSGMFYQFLDRNDNNAVVGEKGIELSTFNFAEVVAASLNESYEKSLSEMVKVYQDEPFTVVLASQISLRSAQQFAQSLNEMGYDQARVLHQEGLTRVVYGHYATSQEAYRVIRRLQNISYFSGSWVLKVN